MNSNKKDSLEIGLCIEYYQLVTIGLSFRIYSFILFLVPGDVSEGNESIL